MTTKKLYWDDPFALSFETPAVTVSSWEGRPSLVLGETLFYPEAGGQLGDTGSLAIAGNAVAVVDTQVTDDGVIHHIIDALPDGPALGSVRGAVDKARRLDHMAQHTAQHMLSAALADVARADTVSARLGQSACTIDLDLPGLADRALAGAEDLVNDVIRSDVTIRAFFPTDEELRGLKLRRTPKVSAGIRVVDVEGFDQSPCGGTHCTRTGQVGVVRVTGIEKYKGKVRVTFHAAARALTDMRARDAVLEGLGKDLTCGTPDLGAAVTKLKNDLRAAREALGQSRAELARLVADEALASHPAAEGKDTQIVVVRDGDDIPTLRVLAGRLASRPDVVAICASKDGEADGAVVIQRGAASSFDCGAWMKEMASAHSGRGGGRPERAEGRLPVGALSALIR